MKKILIAAFNADPVLKRLGKVAAVGGVFAIASALYFESRIRRDLISAPYCKESFRILKNHEGIVNFLGPPIAVGKIDLGSKNNIYTSTQAQIEVPITGKAHSGYMHLWASCRGPDEGWSVDRVEVSVDDRPGQRILVHRVEKQEQD